jgi:hypothetical protein
VLGGTTVPLAIAVIAILHIPKGFRVSQFSAYQKGLAVESLTLRVQGLGFLVEFKV